MITDVPVSDEMVEAGAEAVALEVFDVPLSGFTDDRADDFRKWARLCITAALAHHHQDPRVAELEAQLAALRSAAELVLGEIDAPNPLIEVAHAANTHLRPAWANTAQATKDRDARVRANERERCARVAKLNADALDEANIPEFKHASDNCRDVAAAIRSLSNQEDR